ncbi:MAG: flagellar hook-associated protein FlgK [Fimbriimonadales bacterium]|nr:flagellar hook-associated protein FlgK [Fimbriimonadales bacterium]
MSSFYGIELGIRALRAFQTGMDVTGHNVANVNTPGYTRRRVVFTPTPEYALSPRLRLGSGVMAQSIQRLRDMMLEQRINANSADLARLDTLQQQLKQIEGLFNEPGELGISARLNALFNAFEELATRPDSLAARQSVIQAASALADAFRSLHREMITRENQLLEQAQARITEANQLAAQLGRLNEQIRAATSSGAEPGDLLDQRDRLLTRLSELVGARAHYAQDGSVMVYVDGHTLVQDGAAFPLPTTLDIANRSLDSTPTDIRIQSGELRGLMDAIANLRGYRADLNTLASTLITQVNAIHSTGYALDNNTGYLFFDGTDASNITLHADISDPRRIAAASVPDAPGNGGVARALADLRTTPQGALGGVSITQYYRNLIGRVGNEAQVSKTRAESQQLTVEHLRMLRESVSGVSLDEEAANLVKYQRSYQAAAKMISAFDSLLEDMLQFVAPR